MRKALPFFFLLFMLNNTEAHPFYVSVTQIDYKEKTLQITLKIFIEDLEKALNTAGKPSLNLGEKSEIKESEQYIQEYLKGKFRVTINNTPQMYSYVGKEEENDAVWVYLEISTIENVNSLEVYNSIITEQYSEQTNLVHTNIDGTKKSLILNKNKPVDKLTY